MNHTTKKWTILLCTVILAAGLTACSKTSDDESQGSAPATSSSPSASAAAPASPSASADSGQTRQGSGEYVGAADPHTVEIQVDGAPQAYQLGEGLEEAVGGLKKGDAVSFEYTTKALENGGTQLVLLRIEKTGAQNDHSSPAHGQGNAAEVNLPASKELSLNLEGNAEKKTAKLAKGQGFALYVFDIFSFDAKLGLITMNVDKNYYARIEKLPDDYKPDDIKKTAKEQLAKVGEVHELQGSEIHPSLGGAAWMLVSSNDKLAQEVIVKEVDGAAYRIEVNMPVGEPSEGFGPHLFVMLSTLTNLPG